MPSVKKRKINRKMPYGIGAYAIEASHKRWKPLKHLIIVIEFLLFLVQGKLNRLMIFMPPRHGKSELISKYFLSWYLGTFLEKRAILASYGAGFAAKWGRETRDLLQEYGEEMFLSEVLIRNDSKASHKWDITGHKGGLVTGGTGGPLMGEGANLFIIDDPHKDIEEAKSKTYQEKAWEWYLNVGLQRVETDITDGIPGAMVYIAQRLDINDLAGKILKNEPHITAIEAIQILRNGGSIPEDTWVVLNLPLLAEENDILGREPGETLWPERVDKAKAARLKKTMGSFRFSAVHQGNPQEREGSIFKRWWFYDKNDKVHPHLLINGLNDTELNSIRYWDFGASGDEGDAASGFKSSYDEENEKLIFRKIIHGKYSAKKMWDIYVDTTIRDGRKIISEIEQEPGSHSKVLISRFKQDKKLKGYKIRKDKVNTSKASRSFDLEAMAENKDIQFDTDNMTMDEIHMVIDELIKFTGEDGGEDNIVDTMTGSARYWMNWKNRSRTRVST